MRHYISNVTAPAMVPVTIHLINLLHSDVILVNFFLEFNKSYFTGEFSLVDWATYAMTVREEEEE